MWEDQAQVRSRPLFTLCRALPEQTPLSSKTGQVVSCFRIPLERGIPSKTYSTRLGKWLNYQQDNAVILSNRNSFSSATLGSSRVQLPGVTRYHTKSAPKRKNHADRTGKMKRGKPPVKPSRVFPGAWRGAARDCRYSHYPYEKLPMLSIAHLQH